MSKINEKIKNLKVFLNENQIFKLNKKIFSSNNIQNVFESLNKISIDECLINNLIKEIFKNNNNLKLKILFYVLITFFNENFFNDEILNEKNFLEENVNNILNNKIENIFNFNEKNYYLCFIVFNFFILKLKFNINLDYKIIVNYLNNNIFLLNFFYNNFIDQNIKNINNFIKECENKHFLFYFLSNFPNNLNNNNLNNNNNNNNNNFNYNQITNFILFIQKKKYFPLFKNPSLNNNNNNNFIFFPNFKNISQKISSLYLKKNHISKLLFYGKKSSGKTTFAKLLLSNPLIIEIDENIEINYLLGGYLINEFSEIIWEDGLLLSALKEGKDILLLSIEKSANDFIVILKQLLEKNFIFVPNKQEFYSNFQSKIIMIYNTNKNEIFNINNNNNKNIFNLLNSNSFSFYFNDYEEENLIEICVEKFKLNSNEKEMLTKIIKIYNKIPNLIKINSRFKKLTLNNILFNAEIIKNYFNENNLNNEKFINENNLMTIISNFFYYNLFTIDDKNILNEILTLFSNEFNFNKKTFENLLFNFNEKFLFSNNNFNFIQNFNNEKIFFNDLINNKNFFSYNNQTKFYIKLINNLILNNKNILLVGETGVGKTRIIQNLAEIMGIKLNVINLSQSSDESDLFGGFKPVSQKIFLKKYFNEILNVLEKNFDVEKNKFFIDNFYKSFNNIKENNLKSEENFIKFCLGSLKKIESKINNKNNDKNNDLIIKKLTFELNKLLSKYSKKSKSNAFKYIEGILLNSLKNDEWILLDEINLANDEMLLKLKNILEGNSIFLMKNNQINEYKKIKNFRIFGSMNPEFNIGKKKLPFEIRNLFNELFINEIDDINDIKNFVKNYLNDINLITNNHIELISNFYKEIKTFQKNNQILKSNGNKCNFSLRTLTRCLISIRNGIKIFKNLDFCIYQSIFMNFISQINKDSFNLLSIKNWNFNINFDNLISIFNISISNNNNNFILTETFKTHLKTLILIIKLSNYAVLLEGPTSVGKTSIVEYLAKLLNQKILRINNNQNTEVEEYLGSYTTDSNGNFYFKEGFLVQAVKEGFWIILDEINLAPSEILEALNRLLDDNRELYLPEKNITIKAHENFRIFAAMNPSENYNGRKDLSDAFKNRFIHIYFDNIPNEELKNIVQLRCNVPESRAKIMIEIFNDLQMIRSNEKIFMKNEGFITIRDLIKWGYRYNNDDNDYLELAFEGFFILGEKLSNKEDKEIVKKVIEKKFKENGIKNVNLNNENLSNYYRNYVFKKFNIDVNNNNNNNIKFTTSFVRLLTLIDKSLTNHESVLLIGDTGTGRNLSCEFLSNFYKIKLVTINCHENMDVNDFLGSLQNTSTKNNLFEWKDGPVTTSLKEGNFLLIDEISLVLDSVLERMNSIFETDSVLILSEKNENVEIIKPHKNFFCVGTICLNNDGKKEISDALKSRFTEIYIENINDEDVFDIIKFKVNKIFLLKENEKNFVSKKLFDLYLYFNSINEINKPMNFRDIEIICNFINNQIKNNNNLNNIFNQAIKLTLIEGLFLNENISPENLIKIKENLIQKFNLNSSEKLLLIDNENFFGINNHILNKLNNNNNNNNLNDNHKFIFSTETLKKNLLKILLGLSLKKPILIEGSPGIGKTTIIQNIARKINKKINRVNLSEFTDMNDLIGGFFPFENKFKWIDGILLKSIKNGEWLIIDEMNLANHSILEGLNKLLENQQEIFVPELNSEFKCKEGFQIFATQNPVFQGGGRKFLPKNFLNRFIKIYLDELNKNDYVQILEKMFDNNSIIKKLVDFNEYVKFFIYNENKININEIGEFNLRTMIKFLDCFYQNKYNIITIVNTLYLARIRDFKIKNILFNKRINSIFLFYYPKNMIQLIHLLIQQNLKYNHHEHFELFEYIHNYHFYILLYLYFLLQLKIFLYHQLILFPNI